jgi:predicted amino acid-binding ACT domain protein
MLQTIVFAVCLICDKRETKNLNYVYTQDYIIRIWSHKNAECLESMVVDIASHDVRSDARIEVHNISQMLANKLQNVGVLCDCDHCRRDPQSLPLENAHLIGPLNMLIRL